MLTIAATMFSDYSGTLMCVQIFECIEGRKMTEIFILYLNSWVCCEQSAN